MKRGLGKSGTRDREENREKTIEARKTSESSHGHVVSRSKGRDGQEGQPSGRLYVQQRYRKVKQWTALPFHGAGALINISARTRPSVTATIPQPMSVSTF